MVITAVVITLNITGTLRNKSEASIKIIVALKKPRYLIIKKYNLPNNFYYNDKFYNIQYNTYKLIYKIN